MATPIGNLRDVGLRALDVLKAVDAVIAEDTRVTARLLAHYGMDKRLIAVHEHNERRATRQVLALLAEGKSLALACDAGTPGVSDPGALLVGAAREAGYAVIPIPGPNAAIAAMSAAGFTAPHFLFYGFLPARPGERRRVLEQLAAEPYTLVFHEAPHRVRACVADLAATLGGGRRLVLARELTKLHETIHACEVSAAGAWLDADAHRSRGEFVLIVEGAQPAARPAAERARNALKSLLAEVPVRTAVRLAAELTGSPRNDLYRMALELKDASRTKEGHA